MVVLGLDTTGAYCTAALVDGQEILSEKSENIGRGHAERLAPMVQEVLDAAQLKPSDIERIGVCTGPGSFTGLRVALAFAKGFALPRKLPVIGVSALEALAAQAGKARTLSLIDVRRGEVCWGLYEDGRLLQSPVTQNVDAAVSEIKRLSFDTVVGDGAHFISEVSNHTVVSGSCLAKLVQDLSPSIYPAVPLYSRAPDAKLPGGVTPT